MTNEQILSVLANLELRLVKIEERLDNANRAAGRPAASTAGRIATAQELDGQRGNPEVRRMPKRWGGNDFTGSRFSDCPPELLDELAGLFDWMADKDDQAGAAGEVDAKGYRKDGKWKRLDAALARGWAQRIRQGWRPGNAPLGELL